ncbi:carcinoembryonic antigen-related cell adhesion molecule 3-like [Carassius auratus]|uniref:Carcinoembryonic antigen-related cell adhesion molecule 3-like n=1 Tax=Carassius auratus TaxID=7957 RepID=A0A6P6J2N4_CARAU|nr:carcinoembryonic antigen-related cell adhesion molecule 3-like [Carassius auratus]
MFHTYTFSCLCCWHLVGVCGDTDTVKSVSVKEGDSVTLQINVTEIQTDDKIDWKFGTNNIVIARIRTKTSEIFNGTDGRFRDRLKMDHQTGSLIITNTRTTDSGLYEVKIRSSSRSEDTHRFSLTVYGVFADTDTVKSVSVKEGDSVTLQIHVTEIQKDDRIDWKFGTNNTVLARIRTKTSEIFNGTDGRFRDRLKLDHQTGSLTINNTRTTDSGLYEVKIRSSRSEDTHRFNVTVYGVCGDTDTVKSVSVKEGDSVTLQINVTEIQTDDEIDWKFGTNKILIARIKTKTSEIFDGPDERFRDRLKLDQTGSLIITDTRTTDSGLYEVRISSSSRPEDTHRFNVTVYDCTFCCHVPEAVTRLVISVLVGMAAAFIVVYDITSRKDEQERMEQTSSSSDPHR